MERKIDSIFIRFRGKANILNKLELDDQNVYFIVKGEVGDEVVKSNKDGTVNITYIVDVDEVKKPE